jgi:hypothetical protein
MADESRGDWDDDVVFDDDFVQAARHHEHDQLPPPTAESLREVKREARERKKAARRAARRPAAPHRPQNGWRSGRQWTVAALIAVAGVGAGVYLWDGQAGAPTTADDPALAEPVGADEAASQQAEDADTDPWAGTRAVEWPRGAQGVEPPRARALGTFSKADVTVALANAEAYLQTAMLDDRVVFRGDVDPLLATFEDADYLREQYGSPETSADWPAVATRFRPGVMGPVGDVIRVKGSMKPVVKSGELRVKFSYASAYAVRSLKDRDDPHQLVVIRREGEVRYPYDTPGAIGRPFPGRMTYISDHSVCGRKWPFKAYTVVWLDQTRKPGDKDVTTGGSHDLTDPDDSILDIKGCFSNTGSL